MTNTTKNGGRQTALNLDGGSFDEAAYRAELIAAGLPAEDAAAVVAKTTNARRDALNANEYRLKLIDAGMGAEQAKQAAATAARFLATPEGRAAEAQRLDGFQSLGSIVGASLPAGAKKAAAAPEVQPVSQPPAVQLVGDGQKFSLTKRQEHLISEALSLELEDARAAGATGYVAHFLAQATLPHTDPKTTYFERGTSKISLSINANPKYGMPFGMMPRLLLAWMCTEATLTGSPVLVLGNNQKQFLDKLKLPSDGRYIKSLHSQTLALVRSTISADGTDVNAFGFSQMVIASKGFLFWNPKRPDEPSLWDSTLTLSAEFFDSLINAPVPIKMEALQALRRSPMAMDIYTWLVYRMFTLNVGARSGGRAVTQVPWTGLMAQIGSNYPDTPQGVRSFKTNFLKRLREVLLYYPEARGYIDETPDHLILRAGAKPLIAPRPRRRQIS